MLYYLLSDSRIDEMVFDLTAQVWSLCLPGGSQYDSNMGSRWEINLREHVVWLKFADCGGRASCSIVCPSLTTRSWTW